MSKKFITVGGVQIGGGAPVTVQSMTNVLNERKANSDIRNKQLEDGQRMIDDRKTEFEKQQIINDFLESQNP